MKSKDEILKRAIVLLAFADRCALEKSVIDGVKRTLNERETQRQAVLSWLMRMGYYENSSEKEKQIFNSAVTNKADKGIMLLQNDYECLEPMLWSLGLVNELSDYNNFVMRDFHPILGFGKNHSFEALSGSCCMISDAEIKDCREISMLWYWRCLEHRSGISEATDIKKAIYNTFGEGHIKLLDTYEHFDNAANDFVVNGKKVYELNNEEIAKLTVIAERRFYAFEWMSTDDEWDNIDLVC